MANHNRDRFHQAVKDAIMRERIIHNTPLGDLVGVLRAEATRLEEEARRYSRWRTPNSGSSTQSDRW